MKKLRVLILFIAFMAGSCGPKAKVEVKALDILNNVVVQSNDAEIVEYPSVMDAAVISGYTEEQLILAIQNGTKIDGYEFKFKSPE